MWKYCKALGQSDICCFVSCIDLFYVFFCWCWQCTAMHGEPRVQSYIHPGSHLVSLSSLRESGSFEGAARFKISQNFIHIGIINLSILGTFSNEVHKYHLQ